MVASAANFIDTNMLNTRPLLGDTDNSELTLYAIATEMYRYY
jgi:hypothetical protein